MRSPAELGGEEPRVLVSTASDIRSRVTPNAIAGDKKTDDISSAPSISIRCRRSGPKDLLYCQREAAVFFY